MATDKCDVLEVRVDRLEGDIIEIKQDSKETKQEIKQSNQFYQQTISELKENLAVLSILAQKQDENLAVVHEELSYWRKSRAEESNKSDVSWHQKVLENNHKWLWIVFLIVLGFAFGIDVTKFFGILK